MCIHLMLITLWTAFSLQFVTHSYCQVALHNLWTFFKPHLMRYSYMQLLLYFLPHVFVLPFIHVAYIFFPKALCFKMWASPVIKFLGDLLYQLVFLSLLLAKIVLADQNVRQSAGLDDPLLIVIWIFIAGHIWEAIKTVAYPSSLTHGSDFLAHRWNVHSTITGLCFLVAFVAQIASVICAEHVYDASYKEALREEWPWNDPLLVYEAFFSIGVTLSFFRLFYFLEVTEVFGPLLIRIRHVLWVIAKMFFIALLVIFAFATGLSGLYVYYKGMERTAGDGGVTQQSDSFTR